MPHHDLLTLRQQIDKVDQQLLELLAQRAEYAVEVAKLKQTGHQPPIYYRPEREAQHLRDIMAKNHSLLADAAVAQIFRDIMSACLALQQPLTIAFLGPKGTFSQIAAEKHFGSAVAILPVETISRIFQEVEVGNAHYGVVPIENSTEGVVNTSLDALIASNLAICGEVEIPIKHHFLQQDSQKTPDIIYAHQQSFAQCRQWLASHYPHTKQVVVSSNGEAARLASQQVESAAIASETAAAIYGLTIVTANIEDNPKNTTRFLIIGKQHPEPSGNDKTSLVISTPHTPGALIELVQPFAHHKVNLTLIESRPYHQRNWSYIFFIDIEGHQQDPQVKKALHELASMPIMLTLLGSYPRAIKESAVNPL